eukprot:TRINITY_DN4195_c1_g1_i1.p1 TRINITY_DN4195_c1_g1~~TRINITY_DN4195_c1_g1_i1.p1  ORF type:complete len:306 (-),score=55.19 TRINITY_DN4195_c1_g1_i1:75-992(-)
MINETKVFGVPLDIAAKSDKERGIIPAPIKSAVEWLNKFGLDEEGLYRVNGSESKFNTYRQMFDEGKKVDLEALGELCPENATIIIVKYIKLLPHSIFSNELKPELNKIATLDDTKKMKEELIQLFSPSQKKLPFVNRECIHYLASHFKLVTEHSSKNKMTVDILARTLSIMFGDTYGKVFGMIIEDLAICPSTIVFGLTVEEAAKKTDRSLGLLPSPIKDCIEFIEQGKRWSDDLYVASGSWIEIEDYRAKYDRGENVTFDQHTDVDTVAGILKYYIYEIPENLFTHKLKEQFWAVAGTNFNLL